MEYVCQVLEKDTTLRKETLKVMRSLILTFSKEFIFSTLSQTNALKMLISNQAVINFYTLQPNLGTGGIPPAIVVREGKQLSFIQFDRKNPENV
jgi:hypothetical protein